MGFLPRCRESCGIVLKRTHAQLCIIPGGAEERGRQTVRDTEIPHQAFSARVLVGTRGFIRVSNISRNRSGRRGEGQGTGGVGLGLGMGEAEGRNGIWWNRNRGERWKGK